ncbi:hypothetical protein C8024_10265 [Sphingopyxis sp. BSNA05]|nr:hypothetical protein [Sphingopyxis sp. BSNA05]
MGTKFVWVWVIGSTMHVRPSKLIQCKQGILELPTKIECLSSGGCNGDMSRFADTERRDPSIRLESEFHKFGQHNQCRIIRRHLDPILTAAV